MINDPIEKWLIAEDDNKRSKFIFNFLNKFKCDQKEKRAIPKVIVQYWHSVNELPKDVRNCINSWKVLKDKGFKFEFFHDESAKIFINKHFGKKHLKSYLKCHHPAMRCDYFRLCYLYIRGGFYIDSDELYLNQEIDSLYKNNNVKIQPFCYSLEQKRMIEIENFLLKPYNPSNIYYFNNNPIIAPPFHEIISIALKRATYKILHQENINDIQSTTGPGNLSESIVYYLLTEKNNIEIIQNWNSISTSPWPLSYRNDDRNWRLYNGNTKKWFN